MHPRRYELTDFEWSIIQPLLPNKPRGVRCGEKPSEFSQQLIELLPKRLVGEEYLKGLLVHSVADTSEVIEQVGVCLREL